MSNSKNEISYFQRALWITNVLYYQVIAVISVLLLWTWFKNLELTNLSLWHNSLCASAYLPVMAVAIISFSEDNLWTQKISRKRRYWIHGVMLMISCGMVTAGIWIKYYVKGQSADSGHFKSDHAILGLSSWVAVVVSQITGVLSAKPRWLPKWIRPAYLKCLHNFLGVAGFCIGMGSLFKMLGHHTLTGNLPKEALQIIKWLLWIITGWTVLPAFKSQFNLLASVFSY